MNVSVLIVSFNTQNMLRDCLASLYEACKSDPPEVIVADNDSHDGSAQMVRDEFPQATVIDTGANLGFAAAVNLAYAQSHGEFIALLNPDAEFKGETLTKAVAFMQEPEHDRVGMCGGRVFNAQGALEPSARRFSSALFKFFDQSGLSTRYSSSKFFGAGDYRWFDHQHPMQVDWVPGTFIVIRRTTLEELGFFDERYFMYYEEQDLCLRASRAMWRVWFVPGADVVHIGGGASRTRKDQKFDSAGSQLRSFRMRSEWLFFRKNYGLFSVISNASVEAGWHLLRYLLHCRPGEEHASKRSESWGIVQDVQHSLAETRWGSVSPPRPW